jgi:protein-S-isoprenylcysteine O-methyltransferase Ste14
LADPGDYNNRVHVRKDKTNVRRLGYLTILLFASPPGWPLFTAGIVLVAAGVMLHGWAAGYLARAGYAEREKILTIRGPYRHNRNPYYLAQMTMDLGFFFLAGRPLFYLFYFPVIFFVYRRWVVNEESFLESEFGESYRTFKREVPRWGFRIKAASARGSELSFQWATFMINRELPRSLTHIFLLAIFVSFSFLGNPFSQISVLARVALIAAIAVWLVLHDVYPLDVSQKSPIWFTFAICVVVLATLLLLDDSVWQRWSGVAAWIAIAAALCLCLLFWAAAFPDRTGSSDKSRSWFARPICHWYVLTVGLGLMSCTLGGVWLGIMVPFSAWTFQFAGYVSIPTVPKRLDFSFALLALVVCLGSFVVVRELK